MRFVDLAHGPTVRRPLEPLPGSLGHCEGDYMPEAFSFIEIERQHLEVLPARTVMSMFMTGNGAATGGDGAATGGSGTATGGGDAPAAGDGGAGTDPFSKFFAGVFAGVTGPISKILPSAPGK
jgi:hypothetical protein